MQCGFVVRNQPPLWCPNCKRKGSCKPMTCQAPAEAPGPTPGIAPEARWRLTMPEFLGFDHVDTRVRSLAAVEAFSDRLMPEIGLPEKDFHIVDAAGDWSRARPGEKYNTVEYHEKGSDGRPAHFIGFIEDPSMKPVSTRIAFRIASVGDLDRWIAFLG